MSSIFKNVKVKGHKKHLTLRSLILAWGEKKHRGYRRIPRMIWNDYQPDGISYEGLMSLSKRTLKREDLKRQEQQKISNELKKDIFIKNIILVNVHQLEN